MKQALLAILIPVSISSFSQQKRITIQGKVMDKKGEPVSDVYIVNLATNEKDISLKNGQFTINASPADSLVLLHISYFRKLITGNSLLLSPIVILESEHINIEEVTVSPEQKSDLDYANENIKKIEWDHRPQPGDDYSDSERAYKIMTENNRLMRTEASSVSLLSFSASDILKKRKQKHERKKLVKRFSKQNKARRKKMGKKQDLFFKKSTHKNKSFTTVNKQIKQNLFYWLTFPENILNAIVFSLRASAFWQQ